MRCPNCGQENPAGARFCFSCGHPFDEAPAREERKVVTVLFADLVGFTSRAEQMDPEDVRALLAPYHRRLRSELERFGGTVEKFIGDAVVALFGAPLAHEDDRERAVIFDAFDRAVGQREPQLVTLVGVPGIGKSRLVAELFQRIEAMPDLTWWRQGRALPYGSGVSFWAVGEIVKAQAGINENDTPRTAAEKLRESVAAAVDEHERDWVQGHLAPLLGLSDDAALDRQEAFAAWRRYLEGLAEQQP